MSKIAEGGTIPSIPPFEYYYLKLYPKIPLMLMFNYTNSVTVMDGYRRVQWDINTRLHNSFFHGMGRMA
jgi:hypothetical protein